ncbi:hypothetical protein C1646_739145 [Rhizophagus diaphanus]|nr:hypothetical protein C1646_739145 [Rhizophagus diaphanus] [Rhizophagus sp. MUCL 43196]
MNNFCFCINLKSGVLFIAALAVFLNLFCVTFSYDTRLAFFYIFRLIACVLGFIGIILDNILYVTIFVNYYLVAVIIDFLVSIFFTISTFFYSPSNFCRGATNYETCVTIYITLRVLFTLLIVFADIMQVYFCFALLSYYEKLYEKNNRSGRLVSNDGNNEVSASTYGAVSDQSIA